MKPTHAFRQSTCDLWEPCTRGEARRFADHGFYVVAWSIASVQNKRACDLELEKASRGLATLRRINREIDSTKKKESDMFKGEYPSDWPDISRRVKEEASGSCIRCRHPHDVRSGRVLTVHHFDGDKGNCVWWNLLALCQRCHLSFQSRVNPDVPYMFEHSDWLKPYAAGFYAAKYRGVQLSRAEVVASMDELLALECVIGGGK